MLLRKNKAVCKQSKLPQQWFIGALVCWGLSGCSVGPDYHPIQTKMPDEFISSAHADQEAPPNQPVIDAAKWWEALQDEELNSLITRAIKGNQNLQIALDRVQEARTQEVVVWGGALPKIDAGVGAGAGTGSDLTRGRALSPLTAAEDTGKLQKVTHIAGLDGAWELDLFGKYRRKLEAAQYDTQALTAAHNVVLIAVIADVTRAYVTMRGLQMRLVVLQKNEGAVQDYLKLTQERFDRGITNELDLTLAQRQLASLKSEKAPLVSQIRAAQYGIAVLLGQFPDDLIQELEKPGLMPQIPEKIDVGLPLDLLRRRPDIQEAERNVAAATARMGVAVSDLFPHVSLTGGAGFQGGVGSTIGTPGFIWSVGPSVNWALLDFGALDALVDIADLRTKEALAQYKQTVLNAVREVDTSIAAYFAEQERLLNLGNALSASQRAVELSIQRYNRGLTDSLNVIDSQRQQYVLEEQYVTSQQASAEQFIGLYKALGGGWEQYQLFPPIHRPDPAIVAAFARLLNANDLTQ